eukprot:TRINITY_DN4417_c0_g1_i2.p1 TRINITY_DN4417_c0_g1~~TRINITY_DN4417_c0_g1_i2.p1  ORF type:complete len:614 (+),score=110.20 TRINITY_DN4417_c0_g1_i2:61-1902(+)
MERLIPLDASMAFIETSRSPVTFDPQNEQWIAFDDVHKHVIFNNSGKVSWISYYPPRTRSGTVSISFTGRILCAKLSVDSTILCYQTSPVELIFKSISHEVEFRLSCQKIGSGNEIFCIMWTHINECLVVSKFGVDLYKVNPAKGNLKALKSKSIHVVWYSYSHENRVLLLGTGPNGCKVVAYHFPPSEMVKLPKMDLQVDPTIIVQASDVVVAQIYGVLYCIHVNSVNRTVNLYQLGRDDVRLHKSYIIPSGWTFACNVIDNILIVQSMEEKLAYAYDIKSTPDIPVAQPSRTIFKATTAPNVEDMKWQYYQPNFVFSAKLGYLSELKVNVTTLAKGCDNKHRMIPFLLRRVQGKSSVLKLIRECVSDGESLFEIQRLFDTLNKVYRSALGESALREARRLQSGTRRRNSLGRSTGSLTLSARFFEDSLLLENQDASERSLNLLDELQRVEEMTARSGPVAVSQEILKDAFVVIDQMDVYQNVLANFLEEKPDSGPSPKYKAAVCMEYIRSLVTHELKVNPVIHNCVADLLIKHKEFYTLHQFLQHRLLSDSLYIAHQLLAVESIYPPAFALALDMMKRISLTDQIFDSLVTRQKVLTMLSYFATQHHDGSE